MCTDTYIWVCTYRNMYIHKPTCACRNKYTFTYHSTHMWDIIYVVWRCGNFCAMCVLIDFTPECVCMSVRLAFFFQALCGLGINFHGFSPSRRRSIQGEDNKVKTKRKRTKNQEKRERIGVAVGPGFFSFTHIHTYQSLMWPNMNTYFWGSTECL